MKKSFSIIRLFLLVFFVFGIFQSIYSQTIDSKSAVILEKLEQKHSTYKTVSMQIEMILLLENQLDTNMVNVGFNNQQMKVEHKTAIVISDGENDEIYSKESDDKHTSEYDKNNSLIWLHKMPAFFREDCNVTYEKMIEVGTSKQHILNIEILDENSSAIAAKYYIDTNTLEIKKVLVFFDDDDDIGVLTIKNYEINLTFEADFFEIKG